MPTAFKPESTTLGEILVRAHTITGNHDRLAAGDLRRKRSRHLIETIREGAKHLPDADRALIWDVFELGRPLAEVAGARAESPRRLSRRLHRITGRLLDPRFRFVAEHRVKWRPARRQVAGACILEGLSIREAALRLKMSQHTVRKHKEAIEALCELLPSEASRP